MLALVNHDDDATAPNDEPADEVVVPWERLSPEALYEVIVEFVTREGTDYGGVELPLEEKVEQVRAQLLAGDAVVSFDPRTESVHLRTAHRGLTRR